MNYVRYKEMLLLRNVQLFFAWMAQPSCGVSYRKLVHVFWRLKKQSIMCASNVVAVLWMYVTLMSKYSMNVCRAVATPLANYTTLKRYGARDS